MKASSCPHHLVASLALVILGLTHYSIAEAFTPLHAAKLLAGAQKGDPQCQYRLAQHYYIGEGPVRENGAEAMRWFHKAAEQGYTEAEAELGEKYSQVLVLYLDGQRLGWYPSKDVEAGAKWLKKAADKGHSHSQYLLAKLFFAGEGVVKDDAEGLRWLRKAAEKDSGAALFLSSVLRKGVRTPSNPVEADSWQQKSRALAAQSEKDTAALTSRGFLTGWDLWRAEARLSINYYLHAAWRNDAQAQYIASKLIFDGSGVKRDPIEAYKWCLLASGQNHPDAKEQLAEHEAKLSQPERVEGQRRARLFTPQK